MVVILGSTPDASFDEPLRLLAECHRRIEMFLGVLAKLSQDAETPLTPERREALKRATTYFSQAAPRHTQDEEHSLFPRMRGRGDAELTRALAEIERLESDHQQADAMHAELDGLCREWLGIGALDPASAARVRMLVAGLQQLYAGHIRVEEQVVFTAAAAALDERSLREIGREMADRRGVKWTPGSGD